MLKLFAPIIASLMSSEVQAVTKRAKRSAIFYTIIALAAAIGITFLLIAVYFTLASKFGLINSAFIITAGCVVIIIIAYVINRLLDKAEKRRVAQNRAAIDTNAALTAAAIASVPILLKRPLLTLALPVAGLLFFTLLSQDKKTPSEPTKNKQA